MYRWFWITCIRLLCYNGNSKMTKLWEIWKYALGSFSDKDTAPVENQITIIRTIILLINLACACLIMTNILKEWIG